MPLPDGGYIPTGEIKGVRYECYEVKLFSRRETCGFDTAGESNVSGTFSGEWACCPGGSPLSVRLRSEPASVVTRRWIPAFAGMTRRRPALRNDDRWLAIGSVGQAPGRGSRYSVVCCRPFGLMIDDLRLMIVVEPYAGFPLRPFAASAVGRRWSVVGRR